MQTQSLDQRHSTETRKPAKKARGWKLGAIIAVSCLVPLGALAAAFPKQFLHQVEISTVRQPTPYTELYFAHASDLPSRLRLGRENAFAFTIVNNTGRTAPYAYTVTMSGGGSSVIVRSGSVSIPDGRGATRTAGVEPTRRASRYLITVALSGTNGTNQSIHFYGDTP